MSVPHLRVTLRCLRDDLNLPELLSKQDARSFKNRHPAVQVFVERRSIAPTEGEPIKSLSPLGAFRSLHVGRPRAVTTLDDENDVCWLVGYHEYHASGDRKDSYNYFKSLHERGELLPTADDYERFFQITPESLIQSLRDHGPRMVQEARNNPGKEVEQTFVATADAGLGTATIAVDIVTELDGSLEEGWVGLLLPADTLWPRGGALALARALIPAQVPDDEIVPTRVVGGRPTHPHELAFSWGLDVSGLV